MSLKPEPFTSIASGKKTIELRLYDAKRQLIKIGDEIEFSNITNADLRILVKVIALHRFNSFKELYASLPLKKCGYDDLSIGNASPKDMDSYYSPDEQYKNGVIGIEFQIVR